MTRDAIATEPASAPTASAAAGSDYSAPRLAQPSFFDALLQASAAFPTHGVCFRVLSTIACCSKLHRDAVYYFWNSLGSIALDGGGISNKALLTIARHCPLLETLQLSQRSSLSDPRCAAGSRWFLLKLADNAACEVVNNTSIVELAAGCPRLRRLDLAGCSRLGIDAVRAIATHCSALTELDLSHCRGVDDACLAALSSGACATALQALDLTYTDVGDAGLHNLAGGRCPNLASLRLAGCSNVTDSGLTALATLQLHTLDIFGCKQLTEEGFLRALSLWDSWRHIEDLHLPSFHKISHSPSLPLALVAASCPRLRQLHLFSLDLSQQGAALTEIATACTQLAELDLSCSRVEDTDVQSFVRARGASLQTLNLFACERVDDETLECIAAHCPALYHVNLQFCTAVSDAGVDAISEACRQLHTLLLCGLSRVTNEAIQRVLGRLGELRRLDVEGCSLGGTSGIHALAAGLARHCPHITRLALSVREALDGDGEKTEQHDELLEGWLVRRVRQGTADHRVCSLLQLLRDGAGPLLAFEPAPSDDERVEVWVRRGQVCREVVAAHSSDTDTEARRRSSLAAEILIHPTRMFGSRLIGATDTLSSTYDTLCPFSRPQRAVLHGGLLYVLDAGNNRVQCLTPDGSLRYEFGGSGDAAKSSAAPGRLECPLDLVITDDECIVADSGNSRIQVFTLTGELRRILGAEPDHPLSCPAGLAPRAETIFVADRHRHNVLVLAFASGAALYTIGEPGSGPGQLDWPIGLAVDRDECWVVDAGHHRLCVYNATNGTLLRTVGRRGSEPGTLRAPHGVSVHGDVVYVTEQGQGQQRVQLLARGDGAALEVVHPPQYGRQHGALNHVSAGGDGRLLVCDDGRHCVHFLVPLRARMRRWRLLGRGVAALLALHVRAVERMYQPGGAGYEAAALSFAAASGGGPGGAPAVVDCE